MSITKPNWTKEDLKIYILIYCAKADFNESNIEVDFIKSKLKNSDYEKLHTEFEADNDYQSIQKIQAALDKHGYSEKEVNGLFMEIKKLFLSDGKYDVLEQNLLLGLKHILN